MKKINLILISLIGVHLIINVFAVLKGISFGLSAVFLTLAGILIYFKKRYAYIILLITLVITLFLSDIPVVFNYLMLEVPAGNFGFICIIDFLLKIIIGILSIIILKSWSKVGATDKIRMPSSNHTFSLKYKIITNAVIAFLIVSFIILSIISGFGGVYGWVISALQLWSASVIYIVSLVIIGTILFYKQLKPGIVFLLIPVSLVLFNTLYFLIIFDNYGSASDGLGMVIMFVMGNILSFVFSIIYAFILYLVKKRRIC